VKNTQEPAEQKHAQSVDTSTGSNVCNANKRRKLSEFRVESTSTAANIQVRRAEKAVGFVKEPGPRVLMQSFVKILAIPVHEGYHGGNRELAANQANKEVQRPKKTPDDACMYRQREGSEGV
jgi:hypothetical protein